MIITEYTDKSIVKKAVKKRPDDAHKGSVGTLLSICGSYSMAGAAILAGSAALRSGTGLLKCALPKSIYPIAAQAMWESVFIPLDETDGCLKAESEGLLLDEASRSTAVLMGCGLSQRGEARNLIRALVTKCETPMTLDADALNCIADCPELLSRAKAPVIITPHPAEMGRLIGQSAAFVNSRRRETALEFSEKYNVITVLKGANTVIASPSGRVLINPTGNSGMAVGGSGDVLAGITASLLSQGGSPFEVAAAAVYVHGLAGDLAAQKLGKLSMLPRDIISFIPDAFILCTGKAL